MNLRRKSEMPDDPGGSGSMNDLSFLLIVFFIVIASFTVNKGFILNLPEKSNPRVVQTEDLMRCTLCQDGSLILNGENIEMSQLEAAIIQKQKNYPNMTFLLEIESETKYQNFVDVIDKIRRMDVENFSFKMKEGL